MQTATVTTSMVMVCITSALMAAFKPPYKTIERERERVGNACQDWAEFVHERTFEENLP